MQIVVIGAGIAGLGAATALAQDGHKVIILEKSNMKAEIGAAIHLGANAAGIAMSWGMDPKRVRSVKNTGYCEKSSNNEVLIKQEFDIETAFGAPWLLNHRVDLHNELKRLAIAAGAELRLGVQIDSIDCTGAKVTLKDGTVVEGDCVIGVCYPALARLFDTDSGYRLMVSTRRRGPPCLARRSSMQFQATLHIDS